MAKKKKKAVKKSKPRKVKKARPKKTARKTKAKPKKQLKKRTETLSRPEGRLVLEKRFGEERNMEAVEESKEEFDEDKFI